MKEFLVYRGKKFTIEWYYSQKGKSQPLEYFNELPAIYQQKFFYLIKRIGDFGYISDKTKFRNEGNGIYVFKPQPYRFFSFFYEDGKIIITNAIIKKSQKMRKQEKDYAVSARADYIARTKEGTYYEDN